MRSDIRTGVVSNIADTDTGDIEVTFGKTTLTLEGQYKPMLNVGDLVEAYGIAQDLPLEGLVVNGKQLFFKDDDARKAEKDAREQRRAEARKKAADEHKDEWLKAIGNLPEFGRNKFGRKLKANPDYLATEEGQFELFVHREAQKLYQHITQLVDSQGLPFDAKNVRKVLNDFLNSGDEEVQKVMSDKHTDNTMSATMDLATRMLSLEL